MFGFRIVVVFDGYNRCIGLVVLTAEMGEIDIRRIFYRLYKVVIGRCIIIMTFEIKLYFFLEVFFVK